MYSYQIFSPRHAALSSSSYSSSSSPSSPSSPPPPPPHADIQYGANKVKWDAQELTATYLSCLSLWFALSFPPLNPSLHSSPLNRMVCQSAVCICPSPPSLSLSLSLLLSLSLSVCLSLFCLSLPRLLSPHSPVSTNPTCVCTYTDSRQWLSAAPRRLYDFPGPLTDAQHK